MLRNIASINSFVFKSLIRIIPKQVIVLFSTGVGETGQIIGETGVGEMGVGETGTSR